MQNNDALQMAIDALDYMLDYASLTDKEKEQSVAPIKAHQALMALRQHQQDGGWLPIETMPYNKFMLVSHGEHFVDLGVRNRSKGILHVNGEPFNTPTHWRPLPPAPKKENDE